MSEIKSHSLIVLVCIAIMIALALVHNAEIMSEKHEAEYQLREEAEKRQEAEESLQELKVKIEKLEEENKRLLDRLESFLDEFNVSSFTATAYAPFDSHGLCSDGNPSSTATGTYPTEGRTVAVDPSVIPLGSRLIIEGQGVRVAEDTGGLIKGKRVDIMLDSRREALRFGRQEIKVIYEGVKR